MCLNEFLEYLNPEMKVNLLYYGCIEYSGMAGDVPLRKIMGRDVIPGHVVFCEGELLIEVECTIPERNIC